MQNIQTNQRNYFVVNDKITMHFTRKENILQKSERTSLTKKIVAAPRWDRGWGTPSCTPLSCQLQWPDTYRYMLIPCLYSIIILHFIPFCYRGSLRLDSSVRNMLNPVLEGSTPGPPNGLCLWPPPGVVSFSSLKPTVPILRLNSSPRDMLQPHSFRGLRNWTSNRLCLWPHKGL